MNLWRGRLIRPHRAIKTLLTAGVESICVQIGRIQKVIEGIQWDIAWAEGQPAGFQVTSESGDKIPKEDWILEAAAEVTRLEGIITSLEARKTELQTFL